MRWVQARRPKRYKTNAFFIILHMKGAPGAATKWIPKSKTSKINRQKLMFFADALGALWRPLWVVIFLSPHPGASRWSPFVSRNICKRNAFLIILHMKGAPGAATKWIPKSKNSKINRKNECFSQMPWALFGVHFGCSFFFVFPSSGLKRAP